MSAHQGVTSLDDIYYDLEGAEKLASQVTRFSSEGAAPRRTRDIGVKTAPGGAAPGAAAPAAGARFVARRPPDLQTRYQTLFWLESQFPRQHDFGYLIGPACQILEAELHELLTEPARAVAGPLAAALEKKDRKQAGILNDWAAGKVPSTIGVTSLVLLGLRRALDQGDAAAGQFLDDNFRPGYRPLVAGKQLGSTLDRVREQFRNPACHALRLFDAAAYEEFTRLAVANLSFAAWNSQGPLPDEPPGQSGLLHHHLQESRRLPEGPEAGTRPDPVARLLSLAAPRRSDWTVHLRPEPAAGLRTTRDIRVTPARMERPFRLGDSIRFAFQTSQYCRLALIDIGTSGKVAVVLPNAWRPEARVTAGRTYYLPGPDFPDFEFTLEGQPGRERAVAIAWRGAPPGLLQPEGDAPFRVMSAADIEALADSLERIDPASWAASACEWEIRA